MKTRRHRAIRSNSLMPSPPTLKNADCTAINQRISKAQRLEKPPPATRSLIGYGSLHLDCGSLEWGICMGSLLRSTAGVTRENEAEQRNSCDDPKLSPEGSGLSTRI